METQTLNYPPYVKLALTLLSLSIIILVLYFGQSVLIPLFLALLFAIILRPVVVFFNAKLKLPHVIAVLVSVVLFVILIATIILFISWQISYITEDWNKIQKNFSNHYEHIQHWIKQRYHVSYYKQKNYIQQVTQSTMNGNNTLVGNTLSSFTDTIINIILTPIYTFLILLYRNLFIQFLSSIVSQKNEQKLIDVLINIKTVVQSYIVGLLLEMGVVGILTTSGLMLLGVQYAVLLGVITAMLNLIPYIGIFTAVLISILVTLVTSTDPSLIVGILGLNLIVQFIDNNILVPKIVGNKIRINALASMVGIIIGGAIAGIAGMFLAIPIVAILKVIFDRVEPLKPWGKLIGDDMPKTFEWRNILLPDFNLGNSSITEGPQTINDITIDNKTSIS
ncbi:MAG: AI-2E family transporter [Bacteroidetes bacterium]|nr:AI-2E family transporter [Bacteroidota bacterium]HET6245081.1 AI-2E family transporter [Bacteroidia bacterium]